MRKSRNPRSNLSKDKLISLRTLRNNDKIVALKTEKDGVVVVLDNVDYVIKMEDNLDCSSYKKIKYNPMPRF